MTDEDGSDGPDAEGQEVELVSEEIAAPTDLPVVTFDPAEEAAALAADEAVDPDQSLEEPLAESEAPEPEEADEDTVSALAGWLETARASAALSKDADGRSRAALYEALGQAYDFSIVAAEEPEAYAALLDAAELTVQARAPMTPIVKLVFGLDYDKTRLTEFAAALSYGHREGVDRGAFEAFVSQAEGGLKGLVAAERLAKRGEDVREPRANPRIEKACESLRQRDAIDLAHLGANEEFALVLVRRDDSGGHAPIARVIDDKLLDRAILNAAR